MADLVRSLLGDLGLYDNITNGINTFPELIIWLVTFVVGAALVAGMIKTILIICHDFANGGFRRW